MMTGKFRIAFYGSLVAAGILGGPARADEIDGEWCTVDGKQHMLIQGPGITTPAGKRTEGNYTRHAFSYVVPEAEPGTGATVRMVLVNEQTVHSQTADAAASAQPPILVWQRCRRPVS
jgi:hypothetical protein